MFAPKCLCVFLWHPVPHSDQTQSQRSMFPWTIQTLGFKGHSTRYANRCDGLSTLLIWLDLGLTKRYTSEGVRPWECFLKELTEGKAGLFLPACLHPWWWWHWPCGCYCCCCHPWLAMDPCSRRCSTLSSVPHGTMRHPALGTQPLWHDDSHCWTTQEALCKPVRVLTT